MLLERDLDPKRTNKSTYHPSGSKEMTLKFWSRESLDFNLIEMAVGAQNSKF